MKNIFKFLSIALVAGAMMVACDKEPENGTTDTTGTETPDNPQPQVNHNIDITWDGVAQQIGYKNVTTDAQSLNNATVYMFEAAKGLTGDDYELPAFIFQFIGTSSDFGHAAEWQIGQDGSTGQDYFPTEAYIEGGVTIGENVVGDWSLNQLTAAENEAFDATANTISANIAATFYDFNFYYDVYTRYQNGELTQEEAVAEIQTNMPIKECTFVVNGYNL